MTKRFSLLLTMLMWTSMLMAQSAKNSPAIQVTNPSAQAREAVLITVSSTDLSKVAGSLRPDHLTVWLNGKEIPSQFNAGPSDEGLCFVIDKIEPHQQLTFVLQSITGQRPDYTKRTQAELSHKTGGQFVNREYAGGAFQNVEYLRVPPEHKDHSWFIRYEGPGWESDKVGYRFYLDQRNATDVFGKLTTDMVLQQVGLDGFDSYHHMQPWGMDVMKVGKSLGLGSIGSLMNGKIERVEKTDSVTCRITQNGAVYSSIETRYLGWKLGDKKHNLQSFLSIHAGSRISKQLLRFDAAPENVSTGIVKDKTASLISDPGSKDKFGYVATWGRQSLNNDELGLVVFFDRANFVSFTEDEFSHVVKLQPKQGAVQYYFAAAWVKEPGGILNEEQFRKYINEAAIELAQPVKVKVIKLKK